MRGSPSTVSRSRVRSRIPSRFLRVRCRRSANGRKDRDAERDRCARRDHPRVVCVAGECGAAARDEQRLAGRKNDHGRRVVGRGRWGFRDKHRVLRGREQSFGRRLGLAGCEPNCRGRHPKAASTSTTLPTMLHDQNFGWAFSVPGLPRGSARRRGALVEVRGIDTATGPRATFVAALGRSRRGGQLPIGDRDACVSGCSGAARCCVGALVCAPGCGSVACEDTNTCGAPDDGGRMSLVT